MEDRKTWFRVTDPLNPLYGCDVKVTKGFATYLPDNFDIVSYLMIVAMRRVDLLVGDRPFQLVAKEGENLGLLISEECITASPIQEDVVPMGTDRPHGLCLDESEMTRPDGVSLHIVRYEGATQIALIHRDDGVLASATDNGHPDVRNEWERQIIKMFERDDDADDIKYALES